MDVERLILQKGLPAAIDTERLILGAMLTDMEAYRIVTGILDGSDFSLEKHRRIWNRMLDLHEKGQPIDHVTVAQALQSAGQLESVDGIGYLCSLDAGLPQVYGLEGYCRIVVEKAVLRRAIMEAHQLIERCLDPGTDSHDVVEQAAKAHKTLSEASRIAQVDLQTLREYIDANGGVDAFYAPTGHLAAISLPWPRLQDLLGGGLRASELVVVAGRPSHGKSAVAGQMAYHAAQQGKRVALFSLEMDADQLWYRLIAGASEVPLQRWRKQTVSPVERGEFCRTAADIADLPLWISDKPNATVGALQAAIARKSAAGHPPELVIVDYLQLLASARRSESRAQEVSEICRTLKLLAKELRIPIVALAQVRRYADSDTQPPTLDALKESGAIEETADIVLFIWTARKERDAAIREMRSSRVRIEVAKQRNGPVGAIDGYFSARYVRLDEEIEAKRSEQNEIF